MEAATSSSPVSSSNPAEFQPVSVFSTEEFFKEDDIIKHSIKLGNWCASSLKKSSTMMCVRGSLR